MAESSESSDVVCDNPSNERLEVQNKKKKGGESICLICDDPILEARGRRKGHDAIFCEGQCQAWLHRGCAGLSKSAFEAHANSNAEFHCSTCRITLLEATVATLKKEFYELKSALLATTTNPRSCQEYDVREVDTQHVPSPKSYASAVTRGISSLPTKPSNEPSSLLLAKVPIQDRSIADKKFSIVLYGVKECHKGTARPSRFKHDLDCACKVLSELDNSVSIQSIRDVVRLGKYNQDRKQPRPILVKFLRWIEVCNLLAKKKSLSAPYHIKPIMSQEERLCESSLLKERWSLIQSGTSRTSIRIKTNHTILVNDKPHAKWDNTTHCLNYFTSDSSIPNSTRDTPAERSRSKIHPPCDSKTRNEPVETTSLAPPSANENSNKANQPTQCVSLSASSVISHSSRIPSPSDTNTGEPTLATTISPNSSHPPN